MTKKKLSTKPAITEVDAREINQSETIIQNAVIESRLDQLLLRQDNISAPVNNSQNYKPNFNRLGSYSSRIARTARVASHLRRRAMAVKSYTRSAVVQPQRRRGRLVSVGQCTHSCGATKALMMKVMLTQNPIFPILSRTGSRPASSLPALPLPWITWCTATLSGRQA